MNDPYVDALVYRIRHDQSVDYSKAEPLDLETDGFHVKVADAAVRFEMKEHFATEQDAREAVDPFARNWEFDVCMRCGPGCFELQFDRAEIRDRRPTPGVFEVNASPVRWQLSTSPVQVTVRRSRYPSPPTDIDSSAPDVQVLWDRYRRYREGREDLASFAYFCLTVLEHHPLVTASVKRKAGRRRVAAAAHFEVEVGVLERIGDLSSTKGGTGARKREGLDRPLTPDETRFLESAVTRLIRRVAERSARDARLGMITESDLTGQ